MAIVIIIIFGLILDQSAKFLALKNIGINQSIPVINNIFHLTLVTNRGAAFGILKNHTYIFIIASVATIVFIAMHFKREKNRIRKLDLSAVSMALILCGALGNLIDRVRFGYVVDFLDFRIWPVFNIADSLITIGALLLAYSLMRKSKICIL